MASRGRSEATATANPIPLCEPCIRGNAWTYMRECLDTGWVSSAGPFVERFEREVASYVGAKYGIATASGTAALHVALLVAGIRSDDEVLVSNLTFIAPANAVRYVGAWPLFVDVEPNYWQMDPERVVDFVRKRCVYQHRELKNRATGRRVAAILPVHILGHPVDMDPIRDIAAAHNLVVIEDATESLGAHYKGTPVGRLGQFACLSFNGNKTFTTGGGGMVVTDDPDAARRIRYLTTQAKTDPLEHVHGEIGYNYRMTNIQAALGCSQIELAAEFLLKKRQIASRYASALADIDGLTVMKVAPWANSACWLSAVSLDAQRFGVTNRTLIAALAQESVQTRLLWQPLHLSPAHAASHVLGGEVSVQHYHNCLALPSSVGLTNEDQDRVTALIRTHASPH